jgi:hypothetical protein
MPLRVISNQEYNTAYATLASYTAIGAGSAVNCR